MIGGISYGSFSITRVADAQVDPQTAAWRASTFLARIGYQADPYRPLTFTAV